MFQYPVFIGCLFLMFVRTGSEIDQLKFQEVYIVRGCVLTEYEAVASRRQSVYNSLHTLGEFYQPALFCSIAESSQGSMCITTNLYNRIICITKVQGSIAGRFPPGVLEFKGVQM